MLTRVFVYGTLKTSFRNWSLYLDSNAASFPGSAQFVGPATTASRLVLFVGRHGVPYLIESGRPEIASELGEELARGEFVKGELYDVCEEKLRHLDELEGCSMDPPLYNRREMEVVVAGGAKEKAQVYVKNFAGKSDVELIRSSESGLLTSYEAVHHKDYHTRAERGEDV